MFSLRASGAEENFELLLQGAALLGRYDWLKDIQRLEEVVTRQRKAVGYAILLTNDDAYWSPNQNQRALDAAFRVHEGRTVTGMMRWTKGASLGTIKGREDPIALRGSYKLEWHNYSDLSCPDSHGYAKLRYLLVRVTALSVRVESRW